MGNCTYNWDDAGNRLSAGGKNYTPNAYNQYTAVTGDVIHNGSEHEIDQYKAMTYKYYGDTYLSSVSGSGKTYQLYYDALGRCVERKTDGVAKYYLYDGEHWIQEYLANGTSYSGAVYGLGIDEILGRGVNGVAHWPLPDRNGNTAVVTSSMTGSGSTLTTKILEQYRYDAFGTPVVFTGGGIKIDSSAIGNRFLFTAREYNSLFGFYEYRARAYHPGLGRFMSEDPKGFDAGDYNWFRYCGNDPWDRTDPMGLYGMGPGFTPEQWKKFDKAQQAAAARSAAAAERIDKTLASAKGDKSTTKAFEKVFGKGSATAENMSKVSQTLKGMVTALRDDGPKGYFASGISGAEVARQGFNPTTTFGIGAISGKTIQANLDHRSYGDQSALTWTAGHESAHNFGLEHGRINGVTAYKYGNAAERQTYKDLPSAARLGNPDNYMDFAR
jgi:RHS repeat-associated protein